LLLREPYPWGVRFQQHYLFRDSVAGAVTRAAIIGRAGPKSQAEGIFEYYQNLIIDAGIKCPPTEGVSSHNPIKNRCFGRTLQTRIWYHCAFTVCDDPLLLMTPMMTDPLGDIATASPFDPADEEAYAAWREQKLAGYPRSLEEVTVEISDGFQLSGRELDAMNGALKRANLAVYRLPHAREGGKAAIRQLGHQFGLEQLDNNLCSDEDSITSLTVVAKRREGEYIPYTSQRLNWHTDGYYNSPDRQIRGVILHCVQPAATGGENAFLDHEIAYMQLRDENPAFVRALMAPDAMTIPPNVLNGREIRPQQTGPVFSIDASGHLHMRYSARTLVSAGLALYISPPVEIRRRRPQ
jgi:hypothetical protein